MFVYLVSGVGFGGQHSLSSVVGDVVVSDSVEGETLSSVVWGSEDGAGEGLGLQETMNKTNSKAKICFIKKVFKYLKN